MKKLSDCRVLAVDDTASNIDIIVEALGGDYDLSIALNGTKALEIIKIDPPDLILLDIMMPGMSGFEVCQRLKSDKALRDIPIIFLTAMHEIESKARGFQLGAVDYITKPFELIEVQERVKTHLSLALARLELESQNEILEQKVRERTREIHHTRLEIIHRLGQAAEFKDEDTGLHIVRMSNICRLIGRASGLDAKTCDLLLDAAPMHDVGKIGIPDRILQKPGKLDSEEWRIMKTHADIGGKLLSGNESKLFQMAKDIALTHHEKWDGSGYPKGLKADAIPLPGRICAIADVFDALTSKRPYKEPWPVEQAVDEIKKSRHTHFDADLVDVFVDVLDEATAVIEKHRDREGGFARF